MGIRRCIEAGCHELTSVTRCAAHAAAHDAPKRAVYDDARYRRLRARVLRRWRLEHGAWCPGYGRPGHASHELTIDHVDPLDNDGDPFDERNAGVLCLACNARKQAHT